MKTVFLISSFFVAVLLAGIVWMFYGNVKELPNIEFLKKIAESTTSVVYVLDENKWTEFPLPTGTNAVKIVTNADLQADMDIKHTDSFRYAITYQLIHKNGRVIQENEYHFIATLEKYINHRFSKPITAAFYVDPSLIPTDAKVAVLNFQGMPNVSSLRVRAKSKDPSLKKIVFRISVKENVAESKLGYLWLRMDPDQKTILAKGNIYSQELLFENEIRNLLTTHSKPLGPSGIPKKDYVSRTMYVFKEPIGNEFPPPILPSGVFIDEIVHGVIPLPEGNNSVRLILTSAGLGKDPAIESNINIRWIGRSTQERFIYPLVWKGKEISWDHDFRGGMIEITAAGHLIARAYLVGKKTVDITPLPLYVRTYVSNQNSPIQYKINHIDNQPTLFRINLSFLMSSQKNGTKIPQAHYSLLDKTNAVLKTGVLQFDSLGAEAPSNYDRVTNDLFEKRVSNSAAYYFSFPQEVAAIKFSSDQPILLDAYNRPHDLVREIKVPEDSYLDNPAQLRQPAWYALKPVDYEMLLLTNRTVLLTKQYKPTEDIPDLLKGNYMWEDYHPTGNWFGRNLLTPIENLSLLREDALPSVYQTIVTNKDTMIHFHGVDGLNVIAPNIIYTRQETSIRPLHVYVDGILYYRGVLTGTSGEIRIPALNVGPHHLKIESDANATFYINYGSFAPNGVLKRLVNKLDKELVFDYEKNNTMEEVLSIRYYVPDATTTRSLIAVHVDGSPQQNIGPLRSLSFLNRQFDIRPNPDGAIFVLGAGGQKVDRGEFFAIPLGEDIPPGKYRVHVSLVKGSPGYVSLSRLMPGTFEERKIHIEQEVQNVQLVE